MLGLRATSFGQRSPGSFNSGASFDTTPATTQNSLDMATTAIPNGSSTPGKASIKEEPLMARQHGLNGSANGSKTYLGYKPNNYQYQQNPILQGAIMSTRARLIADFEDVDEQRIESTTIHSFYEYIEQQRLADMPHCGDRWDRTLRWAKFYAIKVSEYEKAVNQFLPNSKNAAALIYVACSALLELGRDRAKALELAFETFYKLGLSLGLFVRHQHFLHVDSHIRNETSEAFKEMLILVCDVSAYYGRILNDGAEGSVSFVFNDVFGRQIDAFYYRKTHIIEAMWKHQLAEGASDKVSQVREWLNLRDKTLENILRARSATLARRVDYTCEWFQKHLTEFCRNSNDVLAVYGPEGCGKTTLYGWTLERLQRSLGNRSYQTLSHTIYSDVPQTATCLGVVKSLTLQLLEINIGDVGFFMKLVDALNISKRSTESDRVERVLWEALDEGMKNSTAGSKNLMIIVDGLNETRGGQQVTHEIADRLTTLTRKHTGARLITFSRSEPPKKDGIQFLKISADDTHDDMRHVIEHTLKGHGHFKSQSEFERENIVEQLLHHAKGSFLWAYLTLASLENEKSHGGFMKSIKEGPKTTDEIMQKAVAALDLSKADIKLLLGWLLVAERPLTIGEVKCLLHVDLQKKAIVDRKVALIDNIAHIFGHLVTVQNGVVAFYHGSIRSYFQKCQGEKGLPALKDAQTDLTTRLLAYCAFSLTSSREPTFECVDSGEANQLFQTHHLLEYAVRHWHSHFCGSTMFKSSGGFEIPAEFKTYFPSSTIFPLLEWYSWKSQVPLTQAVVMHEFAFRIRQDVFSQKHESVLQTLISCGSICEKLDRVSEAATYFYKASCIGQSILRQCHKVTVVCTTKFLSITETVTSTTRTDIMTQKEEMIKFMISTYKHQYGNTHDLVIRYNKMLAHFYADIHEEESAEKIWRELRDIAITRHGKNSEEEARISKELVIVLKKNKKHEDVTEYERCIFDTTATVDIWDERYIKTTFERASSYESRKEFFLAEELYITLWRRLTEYCHDPRHSNIEMHLKCIDVAIEYVRFLKRCKRDEEASSILMCVWMEYEMYDFDSEEIFVRLKTIGEIMRQVRLLSIAVLVFKKCWGWFTSRGKQEYSSSCEVFISETVKEITTTTQTTTVTITTETTVKEIFESTISRNTVTSETITVCNSIISLYMKQERWTDAIVVIQKSLRAMWQIIISGSGTVALPSKFDSEAIDFALHLALCHLRAHHYHEAEEVYIRVYRSCRISCPVEDGRLTRTYHTLAKFYEEHRNWQKLIEIHKEMVSEYRKRLGSSHHLTIKTLYILGSLCSEHGHGHSNEYFEEIVLTLNGNAKVCHKDAVEAMTILCRVYFEGGQWQHLKRTCQVLWETWIHHNQKFKFDAHFIEELHARYIYVLERHDHCDYEILRAINVEYRDCCVKVFGVSSTTTVKAMIELAQICLKNEKHVHEAIKIYEEVVTTTKSKTTTITSTTITTVKEQLSKAYVKVCSHESTTVEVISRAINVASERHEHLRVTYGCAQSKTLVALRELVILHKQCKTQEADSAAARVLLDSTLEILAKETHSKTLYDAAITIGGIFRDAGLVEYGLDVLFEMRRQIITKSYVLEGKNNFKVDKSVGKNSYVFLAAWEKVLRGSSVGFSEIMTDILKESCLYERYTSCRKSESNDEVTLAHAARLHNYFVLKRCTKAAQALQKETFEMFLKKWGGTIKTSRDISFVFFVSLLEHLGDDDQPIDIGSAACRAGDKLVRDLLESGRIQEGYETALCAFQFTHAQRSYYKPHNLGYGFNLSSYMVGRILKTFPQQNVDSNLRKETMQLSIEVIREVLKALEAGKESHVNWRLQPRELSDLVGLLGQQENYRDIELLLSPIYLDRDRKNPAINISVGRRLVEARFLLGFPNSKVIRVCYDIWYNLRQALGPIDSRTLEMQELLSQLYTSAGHHREAMGVHEDVLRLAVEGDDEDNRKIGTQLEISPQLALKHLQLLKRCYQRLGGWDKSAGTYKRLVDELLRMKQYGGTPEWKGVQSTDKWNVKEKPDKLGEFIPPIKWEFGDYEYITEMGDEKGINVAGRGQKFGIRRALGYWGSELARQLSHGHLQNGKTSGLWHKQIQV